MQTSPLNYLHKLKFSRAYTRKLLSRELLILKLMHMRNSSWDIAKAAIASYLSGREIVNQIIIRSPDNGPHAIP